MQTSIYIIIESLEFSIWNTTQCILITKICSPTAWQGIKSNRCLQRETKSHTQHSEEALWVCAFELCATGTILLFDSQNEIQPLIVSGAQPVFVLHWQTSSGHQWRGLWYNTVVSHASPICQTSCCYFVNAFSFVFLSAWRELGMPWCSFPDPQEPSPTFQSSAIRVSNSQGHQSLRLSS